MVLFLETHRDEAVGLDGRVSSGRKNGNIGLSWCIANPLDSRVVSSVNVVIEHPLPVGQLQEMWKALADRYFHGKLPPIRIEWSSRLTASTGLFVSQVGPRNRWVSPTFRQGASRVIRLSAPLLQEESVEEIRRTLAHEMIHQWEFDIRKRRPSHGDDFRRMMQRMNEDGLQVRVQHDLESALDKLNRYAWQCVDCGLAYYRHRRTIYPARHMCSRCHGSLVEVPLSSDTGSSVRKTLTSASHAPKEDRTPPVQLRFDF